MNNKFDKTIVNYLIADGSPKSLKLLKKLEWAGLQTGPQMRMGGSCGRAVANCPYCGGIDPKCPIVGAYTKDAVGHQKRCRLASVIKGC
jgi:hypothetical protein